MISIVVCSVNENQFQDFTRSVESTIGVPYEIIRVDNKKNTFSICRAYNEGKLKCQYEIICFIHEDVLFYTSRWGQHLIDIFTSPKIGLVGIYGACYLGLFPNAWIDLEECQGQVIEGYKDDKPVRRSMRFAEHPLTEVAAVDGVFMACRKVVLQEFSFSEDILKGFHGYDMDISMQIRQKYKVVVTSDILILHFSKGTYDTAYYDVYKILFQKWKSSLPAFTQAYSKPDIERLKLKSLKQFPGKSSSFPSKTKNNLQATGYAWKHRIFLKWLRDKIIDRGHKQTKIFLPIDESEYDKGFSKTRALLNEYFNHQSSKAILYSKELDFINALPENIPAENKILHTVIPYSFILDYDPQKTEVFFDNSCSMFYVYMGKHRLYYHKGFKNKEEVQKSFTYISIEQHPNSPHRYLDNEFRINFHDVVADIGAAEGNFSLLVVDIVKELIIVESDPIWIEALYKTFEPWKEKVTIINKRIGGENDEKTVTLNKLPLRNQLTAFKMDVEGAELKVLHQSQDFIRENNIKLAVTLYHRYSDEADIEYLLKKNHYQTSFSKGYLLFIYDLLRPPYFRKGLIKASRLTSL